MTAVYFNKRTSDDDRRNKIYQGAVFVYSPNEHSRVLIDLARELTESAFDDQDSRTAQHRYSVEDFAA